MAKLQILSLLTVIVLCALFASLVWKQHDSFVDKEDLDPDSCIKAMVERLKATDPSYSNKDDLIIARSIQDQTRVNVADFLQDQGVNINSLPVDVRRNLKDIETYDILKKFKRHTVYDEDRNQLKTPDCVIPMNVMQIFKNQAMDNRITITNNPPTSATNDFNSPFNYSANKVCKIDNNFFTSNMKKDQMGPNGQIIEASIDQLAQKNPMDDNLLYHGCMFPNKPINDTMRKQLKDMYIYSDLKGIKELREVIIAYTQSAEARARAEAANKKANEDLSQSKRELAAQRQAKTASEKELAEKTTLRQNAENAANTAYNKKVGAENVALSEASLRY